MSLCCYFFFFFFFFFFGGGTAARQGEVSIKNPLGYKRLTTAVAKFFQTWYDEACARAQAE